MLGMDEYCEFHERDSKCRGLKGFWECDGWGE